MRRLSFALLLLLPLLIVHKVVEDGCDVFEAVQDLQHLSPLVSRHLLIKHVVVN